MVTGSSRRCVILIFLAFVDELPIELDGMDHRDRGILPADQRLLRSYTQAEGVAAAFAHDDALDAQRSVPARSGRAAVRPIISRSRP